MPCGMWSSLSLRVGNFVFGVNYFTKFRKEAAKFLKDLNMT